MKISNLDRKGRLLRPEGRGSELTPSQRKRARKAWVRGCCGLPMHILGLALFDDIAAIHEHDPVGRLTGEADLVGHDDHRQALSRRDRAWSPAPRRRVPGRAPRSARRTASASAGSPARGRWRRAAAGRRRAGADRLSAFSDKPDPLQQLAWRSRSRPSRLSPCTPIGASTMFCSTVMCG